MDLPRFSVIVPVYNGANYIGEAIESVLKQSYQNFELVLVDDASTDNSREVIAQFDDPRIVYIRNERNQGPNVTRNIGIKSAVGDLIAFLDQDDTFHPDKIRLHIEYYKNHPDVGFTYNNRFELDYNSQTIRTIWRPPNLLTPADFLLSFPIAPSDMVITRGWASRVGLFDERIYFYGGEYVLLGRLYIAGCSFGHVDKALNYRRRHTGRVIANLVKGLESELSAQESIFSEPNCPKLITDLRDLAKAHAYLGWGYLAFVQNEKNVGQEYLIKAVELNPKIIVGNPCTVLKHFIYYSIEDENISHEEVLLRVLSQLPMNVEWLVHHYYWAVGHGYLIKALRAALWGRENDRSRYLVRAQEHNAIVNNNILEMIAYEHTNFEHEFGLEAAQSALHRLSQSMLEIGANGSARQFEGKYHLNRAFISYRKGIYDDVPYWVIKAIRSFPEYLKNRGVVSILFRSIFKRFKTNRLPIAH